MMNLAGLAAKLALAEADVRLAREVICEKACQTLVDEAKRVIGTYDEIPPWPPLAESTKAERERLGFAITYNMDVDGREAYVGSDNPKAVWHEWGTGRIPPRPFLGAALAAKEKELQKMASR